MLLDDVMKEGLQEENDPHPQEGVHMGTTFLRVEEEVKDKEQEIPKRDADGQLIITNPGADEPEFETETVTVPVGTGMFRLVRYGEVTVEEVVEDEICDGDEIVKDSWDAAVYFFDQHVKVLKGDITQDAFDDEVKNRSVTGEEAEIDQHSTQAAQPTEYKVECQVNGCCHINTIDSLEDGQTCEDCGEDLDIQDLQDAAQAAIDQAALTEDDDDEDENDAKTPASPDDSLKGKLTEIMKTIPNAEGLPHDRLEEYLKFDLEEKYGITDPDHNEIWEFIGEIKKDDEW